SRSRRCARMLRRAISVNPTVTGLRVDLTKHQSPPIQTTSTVGWKCFIRINFKFKNHKTGASLHSNTVIDVLENLTYAAFIENGNGVINGWVRNVVSRAEEPCLIWSQFEARIKPLMTD